MKYRLGEEIILWDYVLYEAREAQVTNIVLMEPGTIYAAWGSTTGLGPGVEVLGRSGRMYVDSTLEEVFADLRFIKRGSGPDENLKPRPRKS